MLSNKLTVSDLFTGILVICALVITILVIRQQVFNLPQQQVEPQIRTISNWQQIEFDGPRSGPEDAPVEIIEFYDYQCPYCRQVQPTLEVIRKSYGQQISITHQHLPLPNHEEAIPAAIAAECARNQGHFASFHELLFDHQQQLGQPAYDSLAREAGIPDLKMFDSCLKQEQTKGRVTASLQQAREMGIDATPSFMINGRLVSGALPYNRLQKIIDEVVSEKGI